MPPASRGLNLLHSRVAFRSSYRRRHASTAAPKPPAPSRVGATQPVRARNSQLKQSQLIKSQAGAEAKAGTEAPAQRAEQSKTWIHRHEERIERLFTPKFIRNRPYLRGVIFSFVIATPISIALLSHFPLEVRRVTGPSMQPTINADCDSNHDQSYSPTWVLVERYNMNYRRMINRKQVRKETVTAITGDYERGDLVVYDTPHDPNKVAIKRIVAVAGDVVTPLAGYPGGGDPVVIPFNHMWVEGDVNDRKKSVDSNYFGPITTGLVRGKVLALWSPWWNVFGLNMLRPETDDWPAKRQGRVRQDAVHDASINPDKLEVYSSFTGERGAKMLHILRTRSTEMEEAFVTSDNRRLKVWRFWQRALVAARNHHDPETKQCARDIVDELERIHGKKALKAASTLQTASARQRGVKVEETSIEAEMAEHFENATAYEDVRASQRKALESPAKAAMEEMRRQKKAYGEMIDREFEERDKAREARGL